MRSILGIILLFISATTSAVEVGSCIRSGDAIVCNLGCRAFNMATFNEMWPMGVFTFQELGIIAATAQRELTPAELAVCNDTPPPPEKMWRVAYNNGEPDRPTRLLIVFDKNEFTMLRSSERYTVGALCDNTPGTFSEPSTENTEWRYLAGQTTYVVRCEYK